MKDIIKKIEQWAIDREIHKKGTIEGQAIKTAEEIAELIKEIGTTGGNGIANRTEFNTKTLLDGSQSGTGIKLQIGANKDQSLDLKINNMTASGLGVNTVDVSASSFNFNNTLSGIDTAIGKVSAERSKLGATQNRLDHTINNLTTTAENLSEAESRIRDVDMAEEMMAFTKNNILSQAATSMLAQANQMPQSVLQLLQ